MFDREIDTMLPMDLILGLIMRLSIERFFTASIALSTILPNNEEISSSFMKLIRSPLAIQLKLIPCFEQVSDQYYIYSKKPRFKNEANLSIKSLL